MQSWKYYNHAMVPTTPPHEEVDELPIADGSIWKFGGGKPLLARWTTNFDCGYETNWWYTIKDTSFDISLLSSNRRRWIIKARKNFAVRVIDPVTYAEELYAVQIAAFSAYPPKYRPSVDHDAFVSSIQKQTDTVIGAFWIGDEGEKLCGYNTTSVNDKCIEYHVHKAMPDYEKQAINFALVDGALQHYEKNLESGSYISNGQRTTNHETSFNDLLIRDFGFRKAYCQLHIAYKNPVGLAIKMLYPFRKLLKRMDNIGIVHQINAILKMEEIIRKDS